MKDDLKNLATSEEYRRWLYELKQCVERARQRATASVNHELIKLYWQMGSEILQRQLNQGWARASWTSLRVTSRPRFRTCPGSRRATSSTCVRSHRRFRSRNLCNSPLHNYRGHRL
jgi:uncharacterized protein DUF1016